VQQELEEGWSFVSRPGLSKRAAAWSIQRTAPIKTHEFREIRQLPENLLVHSQKNHSLAYNSAELPLMASPAK
jgi:hypothetical protein